MESSSRLRGRRGGISSSFAASGGGEGECRPPLLNGQRKKGRAAVFAGVGGKKGRGKEIEGGKKKGEKTVCPLNDGEGGGGKKGKNRAVRQGSERPPLLLCARTRGEKKIIATTEKKSRRFLRVIKRRGGYFAEQSLNFIGGKKGSAGTNGRSPRA